ncbi:MAG: HYR domain-containing protein [Saprospiraceae bacterium]|nr:HYR domain-containing protein [Saprospiraceae bacterium]
MRTTLLFLLLGLYCRVLAVAPATPRLVLNDSLPVITCPANAVLEAGVSSCTANFVYSVTASDDTPGWTLSQTAGLPSGSDFPIGVTILQFLVTDTDNNTATCSFQVNVRDLQPPQAICATNVTVNVDEFDTNDCYDSQINWVQSAVFNNGSFDNCSNTKLSIRRVLPFSACILALNAYNGHPDCNDLEIDFPTEFEQAVSEKDSIKFYCCESGLDVPIELRVYQLRPNGQFAVYPNGTPVYGACTTTVHVQATTCLFDTHSVTGSVQIDSNTDCAAEAPAVGVPEFIVSATNSSDTLYTFTDEQGHYQFNNLVDGTYTLEVMPPSSMWTVCNNPVTLALPATVQSLVQDFAVQPQVACPVLYTDLGTALIRPCSTSVWTVRSCNIGGSVAQGAYVQILPGAALTLNGASVPYTLNGDTITVQLGDIAVGTCEQIQVYFDTPCDPGLTGQYTCVEAIVFPQTLCTPANSNWSGAQIEVSAVCTGDSVHFSLRNAGLAPTEAPLNYIVIDDMVVMRQGQLPQGFAPQALQQEVLAAGGSALRIMAEQEPNHPISVQPSLAVENCNGISIPSQLLAFNNEDGNPFSDLECRQIVSSFDPNEKLAFPVGYSDQHLIEPNTSLSYQLGFQNTGTDTAFLIVLRDTLSPLLDPATIRMGASSHPYTWNLEGAGVLTVRFEQVLLPDSTTNEPASHGFVRFDIAQKRDNPIGSVLENRAGIYFDINPVVLTNTVFHTVGYNFVPLGLNNGPEATRLRLYPNPATDNLFVPLEADSRAEIWVRDLLGRPLRHYSAQAPGLLLQRDGLKDGLYFLDVQPEKGPAQRGSFMWMSRK